MRNCILILLLTISINHISGQDALVLFAQMGEHLNAYEFEEAIEILEEIKIITEVENQTDLRIYALCYQAYCNYERADYRAMNQNALEGDSIFQNWAKPDSSVLATLYYMLGTSYYELGNTSLAQNYLKASYDNINIYNTFYFRKEDLLNNLALCFLDLADYEKVRLFVNQAIHSDNKLINEADIAQWNNLIAKSYQYEKKYDKAEKYYQFAIKNLEEIKQYLRQDYAQIILNNYAGFLLETNKLSTAEKYINEIENLGPNKANVLNHKQNIAKLALYQNQHGKALKLYDEVIRLAEQSYVNQHIDLVETYLEIADAYYIKGENSTALKYIDYSLEANKMSVDLDKGEEQRKSYYIPKLALNALLLKTKCYAEIDYSYSKVVSLDLITILHQMLNNDLSVFESKLYLVQFFRSYIEELINLSLLHGDVEGAFLICQKSHGLVLDLQVDETMIKNQILDESTLNKDYELKRKLTSLKSELFLLNQTDNVLAIEQKSKEVFLTQYNYDQFRDSLEFTFPQLNQVSNTEQQQSEKIRKTLLSDNKALIEYYLSNEKLYCFLVSADSIYSEIVELPLNFQALVESYLNCTSNLDVSTFYEFSKHSYQLYSILFPKLFQEILPNVNTLFIIPDGILNYISFDALIQKSGIDIENNRYDLLDYLVHSYEINYNYSSLLYSSSLSKNKKDLTGFAPSFESIYQEEDTEILKPLLHNKEELLLIDSIIEGEMFFDTAAKQKTFLQAAKVYNIAHLATHAICNDSIPMKSKIYFDDTYLSTYEIYNMVNTLDLAVLSACNSGTGKLSNGEGIMSLARAFMASGCNSIVTSLWNVNDKISVQLMRSFYDELSDGKHVGYSLHQSKKSYLNNVNSILDAHPYYWSGFILLGDDVTFSKNDSFLKLLILFLLFMFFVLTYYLTKRFIN